MTATVSTNPNKNVKKISPPLHNWKQNVKDNKKLSVIFTVLHMIAAPAVMLALIISIYSSNWYYDIEGIEIIAVIATALAGFLGIFPAVDSFSCLHDKTVVDMKLSLPMTAAQRFVSNFLSGLFTYITPFLSAQVFSLLFALYGRIFMEGRTFYRISFDELGNEIRTPYVCDVFSEVLPALLKLIAGGLLAMLMLYTVTVLITTCCGSKFESIAYTILINALIPLTVLCVTYSIFDDLYGVNPYLTAYRLIMFTSTAGGVFAAIDWSVGSGDTLLGVSNVAGFSYGVWAVVYFLIIAALFVFAFFLYRKRRAEQVSKPFVFKLAYYITVTCGVFCIVSLALDELGLPATLILTAVLYLIFEVVTNRGFKRIWLSIIKYAFTFLGAWAVIVIGVKTEGFGAVYRVPAAAAVTSAEIYYEGFYGDFNEIGSSYSMDMPIVIKDKDNIKTIISAHKTAVQDYKEYEGNVERYSNSIYYAPLTIKYNLIGGGSFYRRYDSLCPEAIEILTALNVSEEYKTQIAEIYRQKILNVPEKYKKTIEYESDGERTQLAAAAGSPQEYVAYGLNRMVNIWHGDDSDATKVTVSSLCARGFYEQLADAYYNDIMAINEENYFRSELKNVWQFYTFTGKGGASVRDTMLIVPESFENTVALLDNFDFNLTRIETADEQDLLARLMQAASSGQVTLYTADEWREANKCDEGVLHAVWRNANYDDDDEYFVYDFDENFMAVLRSIMPRNIVSENGYIISIYNFSGAVPEEMNEAAAAVTRTGRDEDTEKLYYEIAYGESKQYYD